MNRVVRKLKTRLKAQQVEYKRLCAELKGWVERALAAERAERQMAHLDGVVRRLIQMRIAPKGTSGQVAWSVEVHPELLANSTPEELYAVLYGELAYLAPKLGALCRGRQHLWEDDRCAVGQHS